MPTTRETVLAALHARLQPLAALTLRDEVLPERIPAAGLIILRDGQPGEPEVTLSPLRYHYQHRAELEIVVQAGAGRASVLDDRSPPSARRWRPTGPLAACATGSNRKPRPRSTCR